MLSSPPLTQTDPLDTGAGPLVNLSKVNSPMTGDFTVARDVMAIAPTVVSIANRFSEYEASGSTAWDATVDVPHRPDWLKKTQTKAFEPKKVHRFIHTLPSSVTDDEKPDEETGDDSEAIAVDIFWVSSLDSEAIAVTSGRTTQAD